MTTAVVDAELLYHRLRAVTEDNVGDITDEADEALAEACRLLVGEGRPDWARLGDVFLSLHATQLSRGLLLQDAFVTHTQTRGRGPGTLKANRLVGLKDQVETLATLSSGASYGVLTTADSGLRYKLTSPRVSSTGVLITANDMAIMEATDDAKIMFAFTDWVTCRS